MAVIASSESLRLSFSKSTTVDKPNPAALASVGCDQSSKALAARDCAGVILSTFSVDAEVRLVYQHNMLTI